MSTTMELDRTDEAIIPAPGVFPNVEFARYCQWDCINWHTLLPYRKSAKAARHEMLNRADAKDCQLFGGAFHAGVLEREKFDQDYAIMPQFEGHPNSTAHKNAKAEWKFNNAAKIHLTQGERADILAMASAIHAHPKASAILAGKGRNELSICWKDKLTGSAMKARVDRLCRVKIGVLDPSAANPEQDVICDVDLKTTRDIENFEWESAKYGYHGQMGMRQEGLTTLDPTPVVPIIIAAENVAPFDAVVYWLDDATIENGKSLYRRLLQSHLACKRVSRWPGISDGVCKLFLPPRFTEPKQED